MKYILETEKLSLREFVKDDLDALKKILHDGKESDEYVNRWLNWCIDSYQKYGFGLWAVIYKATNEVIGSCGVSMQPIDGSWVPEIGYHIRNDYHRQGLGKEVTKGIKDYFFSHFQYDEVYSYMDVDNIASYKTAIANGMTYIKNFIDKTGNECRIYKITRKEWEKENK